MRQSKLFILILTLHSLSACTSTYDPYAGYSVQDREKLIADHALRAQEGERRLEQLQQSNTLSQEAMAYRLRSGDTSLVEGRMNRGEDVFEGRWKVHQNPYTQAKIYTYDKGDYHSHPNYRIAHDSNGVYSGEFLYFQDPPSATTNKRPSGTFVMIGSFTRHDAVQDNGIYVAENSVYPLPLHFIKASPAYLERLEQRYQQQVTNYREAALRRAREEQASNNAMFNFGQILALGLGGLMLASADIPSADRMEIGTALFSDVMSPGQSNALATLSREKASRSTSSRAAGTRAKATTQTSSYSFTCPSGQSSTVSISYKSASCLAAKQEMTRIYACNEVGDFQRIATLCQQGCGTPQCTD